MEGTRHAREECGAAGKGTGRNRSWREKKQVPGQTHTSASHSTPEAEGCVGVHSSVRTKLMSLSPRHRLSEAFKASLLGRQLSPRREQPAGESHRTSSGAAGQNDGQTVTLMAENFPKAPGF